MLVFTSGAFWNASGFLLAMPIVIATFANEHRKEKRAKEDRAQLHRELWNGEDMPTSYTSQTKRGKKAARLARARQNSDDPS